MKRIAIIGPPGAGKSTLSVALGAKLRLPVIHLDRFFWKPGWVQCDIETFREKVRELAEEPEWIMDGDYSRTMDLRFPAADTIVFLDFPRLLCLWRVCVRWLRHRGQTRPDLASECPDRMGWNFLKWIWNYPKRMRPRALMMIEIYGEGKALYILHSRKEVARFLKTIQTPAEVVP